MKSPLVVILALLLFISPVLAAAPRLFQGDIVYLGDSWDISGAVGWDTPDGNRIAWYNGYEPDINVAPYIITLPPKRLVGFPTQYNYTIDPAIYGTRLGAWYQYYGNATEETHGNLLAFIVEKERKFVFNQTANSSILAWNVTNQSPDFESLLPVVLPIPERKVADYLVARGYSLNITTGNTSKLWVFGRLDGIYDRVSVNNSISITSNETYSFESGEYDMLLQNMGEGILFFTVRYNPDTQDLDIFNPASFSISHYPLYGLSPQVRLDRVLKAFWNSTDTYKKLKLEVQEPAIDIMQIDTLWSNENVTLLDVRGYTNIPKGSYLKFILDEDRQTARTMGANTFGTLAQGESPGSMRYFSLLIPLKTFEMPTGEHWITAYTPDGAWQRVPYFIWESPEHSYIPNQTIRYIGGNEFVPTPPPEIKNVTQIVTVVQTQIVYQQLTPDYNKLAMKEAEILFPKIVIGCAIFLLVMIPGIYGMSILIRAIKRKRKNDEQETKSKG